MSEIIEEALVSCFLLKVASRCNINCDYCYMYNHLDQSYKLQPKLMSPDILSFSATRILDYIQESKQKRIAIVYHGGEPLLLGTERLVEHVNLVKKISPKDVLVEFSLQTNGILLTKSDILAFEACGLQVSLSIDGPQTANDRHRLDHQGKSSFKESENALSLLQQFPSVFSGVIAVIDPLNNPKEILDFFSKYDVPQLDFLLPDANYLTPPPNLDIDPNIYSNWFIDCFNVWFDQYPNLKIRTFDSILAGLFGAPSETDGFGFGDVNLITIETNGAYHDLDVLKVTGDGTSLDSGNVITTPLKKAIQSSQIALHRKLLKKEGLSLKCQECPVVEICGGGAVAHRFGKNGYDNPSIYCRELEALIGHINTRMNAQLAQELVEQPLSNIDLFTIEAYETDTVPSTAMDLILSSFKDGRLVKFKNIIEVLKTKNLDSYLLREDKLKELSVQPSVVVWVDIMEKYLQGISMTSIDGEIITPDESYLTEIVDIMDCQNTWPRIHRKDKWLRVPFSKEIYFEENKVVEKGDKTLAEALNLIYSWKPYIVDEMKLISPEIQFIRDIKAHPDQVVSFSDNSVPGALYVQLIRSGSFIDPADLADSIIHEHRHQKLYLLQRISPIVNADFPLVKSPWREELRPPTGLFHALYVFVELLDFWIFLSGNNNYRLRAMQECQKIKEKLDTGFSTVENCDLTESGRYLLTLIKTKYDKMKL